MIRSAKQLPIARAFLREQQLTKDWLNLGDVVNRNRLDYHGARRFLLKLVRNDNALTRSLKDAHRQPLDFRLTPEGYSELMDEYMGLVSGNGK